jgi:hypothetical protein
MALDFHKNLTEPELHEVKNFSTAVAGQVAWKDERSLWSFDVQNVLPKAIDIVDNTAVPPTEVDGDVYIIDATGASHADWDGATANSWVRYNVATDLWVEILAFSGALVYVTSANEYYDYNGTTWAIIGGGGGGGVTIGAAIAGAAVNNAILFSDGSNNVGNNANWTYDGTDVQLQGGDIELDVSQALKSINGTQGGFHGFNTLQLPTMGSIDSGDSSGATWQNATKYEYKLVFHDGLLPSEIIQIEDNSAGNITAVDGGYDKVAMLLNSIGSTLNQNVEHSVMAAAQGLIGTVSDTLYTSNLAVGIGTPTEKLHVEGGAIKVKGVGTAGTPVIIVEDGTTGSIFSVLANGRTGVGIATPANHFDLVKDSTSTESMVFTNNTDGASAGARTIIRNNSLEGIRLSSFASGGANFAELLSDHSGGFRIKHNSNIAIQFFQSTAERMRIDAGGNVGIGTVLPLHKLHTVGDTFSTVFTSNAITSAPATAAQDLDVSLGDYQPFTIDTGTTFTISNPPLTGNAFGFVLELTKDATPTVRTLTFPASVKWQGGVAPASLTTTGQVMIITFITRDGGTTWYGIEAITSAA